MSIYGKESSLSKMDQEMKPPQMMFSCPVVTSRFWNCPIPKPLVSLHDSLQPVREIIEPISFFRLWAQPGQHHDLRTCIASDASCISGRPLGQ